MLDYQGDRVALAAFTDELGAATFADPAVSAARDRDLTAVASNEDAALLGALVHHLIAHAASDGAEVNLVERAASLWTRGVNLCDRLGNARSALEAALEDPGAPGAADAFNTAAVDVQVLGNDAIALRSEVDALRADVTTFRHLPPHPRQSDRKTNGWDWANLTAARRTDAFVRAVYRRMSDRRTNAFAFGVAASYGANIAGSAYVGHAVGGPRRSHRHRDRIARNSLGAWLAANHPHARPPSEMAATVSRGGSAATLPADLDALLSDALADTFDLSRTVPPPDFRVGYQRLLRHLVALDSFVMPQPPEPPGQVWMAKLYGDPQNPPPSLRPQDVDVVGQDGGGVAVSYGSSAPGSSTTDNSDSKTASEVCGVIMAILILIDVVQAFVQCIVQWANGDTCTFWDNMLLKKLWEQDPPDPRDPTQPSLDAQGLSAAASSPQVTQFVGMLFDAHGAAWEALSRGYNFLAATGLIYPTGLLASPMYAQFTALPAFRVWPQRQMPDPVNTYHLYPNSPLENPPQSPSPYPMGSTPDVFVTSGTSASAAAATMALWEQIAADAFDSPNRDLDADRGFAHQCWAAAGSVHDDPVVVVTLQYDEQ